MADVATREVKAALHFEVRFSLDLLSEKFAENHLLGEVLCADDRVIGARRRARDKRDGEERSKSSPSHAPHWVMTLRRRSMIPRMPSAPSAKRAAGIAPARTRRLSTEA